MDPTNGDSLKSELKTPPPRPRRWRKWLLWIGAPLTAGVLVFLVYFHQVGWLGVNFHTVKEGPRAVYRVSQPQPDDLEHWVRTYGIKTVLNLRGENATKDWYQSEKNKLDALGVNLVNVKMRARQLPPPEAMRSVLDCLEKSPRPLLLHCHSGADRSGLVSAVSILMDNPEAFNDAHAQLAFLPYGHTGLGDYANMRKFLNLYQEHRVNGGKRDLRDWVEQEYPKLYAAVTGNEKETQ